MLPDVSAHKNEAMASYDLVWGYKEGIKRHGIRAYRNKNPVVSL